MQFELSEKELENKTRWVEMLKYVLDVKEEYLPGCFEYVFSPCGIGTAITVVYRHPNDYVFKKDVTDYESW